ncbi:MAG: hypothetical protein IJO65_12530 [Lachnospiraceae bacterium]|nr:hypothetical protein [Lachnospiraceae bacterium]
MKRTVLYSIGLCGLLTFLTGCGNQIPDMDETTRKLVVEYAAATVREHDINRNSGLMNREDMQEALDKEAKMEAIFSSTPAPVKEEEVEKEETKKPDEVTTDNISLNAGEKAQAVSDVLELADVDITYAGHEITDSYPQDGENVYFAMGATEGSSLVVVKFDAKNLSQEETELDLIGKSTRYKIQINGESKNVLTTMLLNDMANYKGTIAAGETLQLVLVCEMPKEKVQTIESLELNVKSGDKSATISLK